MKLENVINVFQRRNKIEEVLILKMLNTIKDFNRKMDLKPGYRELKQIYEDYEEERVSFVKQLIKDYCDEENKHHKDNPDWEDLVPEEINQVPPVKMEEYNKEIDKRKEKEIELKNKFIFYKDEVERAKLVFSEEELLDVFIDWKKNKPVAKKAKK